MARGSVPNKVDWNPEKNSRKVTRCGYNISRKTRLLSMYRVKIKIEHRFNLNIIIKVSDGRRHHNSMSTHSASTPPNQVVHKPHHSKNSDHLKRRERYGCAWRGSASTQTVYGEWLKRGSGGWSPVARRWSRRALDIFLAPTPWRRRGRSGVCRGVTATVDLKVRQRHRHVRTRAGEVT